MRRTDSQTLFRLAYGCVRASGLDWFEGGSFWPDGEHRMWNIILSWMMSAQPQEGLQTLHASTSFEWLRTRFVLEATVRDWPDLIPLGRRLLAQSPGDAPVMRALATQLSDTRRQAESQEAILICEDGIWRWPRSSLFYIAEGHVYFELWVAKRRPEDAEKLLRLDHTALSLLPPHAQMEANLKRMVDILNKWLRDHRQAADPTSARVGARTELGRGTTCSGRT